MLGKPRGRCSMQPGTKWWDTGNKVQTSERQARGRSAGRAQETPSNNAVRLIADKCLFTPDRAPMTDKEMIHEPVSLLG